MVDLLLKHVLALYAGDWEVQKYNSLAKTHIIILLSSTQCNRTDPLKDRSTTAIVK